MNSLDGYFVMLDSGMIDVFRLSVNMIYVREITKKDIRGVTKNFCCVRIVGSSLSHHFWVEYSCVFGVFYMCNGVCNLVFIIMKNVWLNNTLLAK